MTIRANRIAPIVEAIDAFSKSNANESNAEAESNSGIHLLLPAETFLKIARGFYPLLDALGVAFAPAKADVRGNVDRLEKGSEVWNCVDLSELVLKEKARGEHEGKASLAKGMLWLKRFLEFVVALVDNLTTSSAQEGDDVGGRAKMETKEAAKQAYEKTLNPYHGFVSSSAFSVVLSFPPTRVNFIAALGGEEVLEKDGRWMVEHFGPILKKIDCFLTENGLNDPTKV